MKRIAILIMTLLALCGAKAKVKLPHVLADNMVLQQQAEVKLWGTAKAKGMVKVMTSWNGKEYKAKADAEGRWSVKVSTPEAGLSPYFIKFDDGEETTLKNVLIGEVWLCSGQSNMDMRVGGRYGDPVLGSLDAVVTSKNTAIRVFVVGAKMDDQPHDDCDGRWQEASSATVPDFSAAAYFFACKINEVLGVPVGILQVAYGGSRVEAWMSNEAAAPYKGVPEVQNATILYNGMISPLVGYGIRGFLWYQGEANVDAPDLYAELFPAMVADWRKRWGDTTFPFYYAQIAPFAYNKGSDKGQNSAYLREAQMKCLHNIPASGMIILTDIGDSLTIHPKDKKPVGDRFAYMALADSYGKKGFTVTGPIYKSMDIYGDKVEISFENVGKGLTSFRKPLSGFEIAGADKVFYPAEAKFGKDAKTVIVSSKNISEPVAVRYAFKDYVKGSLFNMFGLPASSFRTDEW